MRREARESVYKLVFEYSFNKVLNEKTEEMLCNSANLTDADVEYIGKTVRGIVEKYDELTADVMNAVVGYSTVERLDKAVYVALVYGAFELKYAPDVPKGVAISEAINLAKEFGGESTTGFVNGTLAALNKKFNG
ncbi:MAG: transcription antitermination protein NusB [Clostridia bacterium]|nr:transcription antitermination protein NusB [Clostridia bacterium]